MGDRVPISTIAGLLSAEVGVDHPIGSVGAGAAQLVRMFLRVQTVSSSGGVDAEIRDASSALQSLTIPVSTRSAELALSTAVAIPASTALFLRITDGGTGALMLAGWYELDAGAPVTTALTTLARVKDFVDIPAADTSADARISQLIAVVSAQAQAWLRRAIVQSSETGELYDHDGDSDRLMLRNFPVAASPVPTATISGTAVAGADLALEDAAPGFLVYQPGGSPGDWPSGRRHIAVDYTHGYSSVPEDIAEAATIQVGWLWKRRKNLGERTATLDESGVGATFLVDAWAPEALEMLRAHRSMVVR